MLKTVVYSAQGNHQLQGSAEEVIIYCVIPNKGCLYIEISKGCMSFRQSCLVS